MIIKKTEGFTLIEMVITIAIIIILASISVPIYRDYENDAILAEGYALLGTIRSAQEAYYGRYENFLNYVDSSAGGMFWTCNDEVLGINARTNKYYTWFCVGYKTSPSSFKAWISNPKRLVAEKNTFLFVRYDLSSGVTYAQTGTFTSTD